MVGITAKERCEPNEIDTVLPTDIHLAKALSLANCPLATPLMINYKLIKIRRVLWSQIETLRCFATDSFRWQDGKFTNRQIKLNPFKELIVRAKAISNETKNLYISQIAYLQVS